MSSSEVGSPRKPLQVAEMLASQAAKGIDIKQLYELAHKLLRHWEAAAERAVAMDDMAFFMKATEVTERLGAVLREVDRMEPIEPSSKSSVPRDPDSNWTDPTVEQIQEATPNQGAATDQLHVNIAQLSRQLEDALNELQTCETANATLAAKHSIASLELQRLEGMQKNMDVSLNRLASREKESREVQRELLHYEDKLLEVRRQNEQLEKRVRDRHALVQATGARLQEMLRSERVLDTQLSAQINSNRQLDAQKKEAQTRSHDAVRQSSHLREIIKDASSLRVAGVERGQNASYDLPDAEPSEKAWSPSGIYRDLMTNAVWRGSQGAPCS